MTQMTMTTAGRRQPASRPARVLATATALLCAVGLVATLTALSSGRHTSLLPLAMALNTRAFFFPWQQHKAPTTTVSNRNVTPSIRLRRE